MTDSVMIEGLVVETVIGVFDWEREIRQRLLIDLELGWDNRAPAEADDLCRALDYVAVCQCATAHLQALQPRLLETAAESLAQKLQVDFAVPWLKLVIRKPGAVPQARSVGVSIERGSRS